MSTVLKARMLIASSAEHLNLAYAAQENLDRDVEATIWSQGVFVLSRPAISSLVEKLKNCEFGLFILSPDDITNIRNVQKQTVRDNVIFELGLSIGHLGVERCFMLIPRDVENLHIPSDVFGLVPATFEANRTDNNLAAALGPACNKIRNAIKLILEAPTSSLAKDSKSQVNLEHLCDDPQDCISIIQSWMGSRPADENLRAIRYDDVDSELRLAKGSTRLYIEEAAQQ